MTIFKKKYMEATTQGEQMIQLDSKIDKLDSKIDTVCESLDRVASALEKLETTRVTNHEIRITNIEKWKSEWAGAYKIISVFGLALAIIATIVSLLKH